MKGFLQGLLPNIGHADAKHSPDIPNFIWKDTRLTSKFLLKKNKEIFLTAAGCIFDQYCSVLNPPDADASRNNLLIDIGNAIGNEVEADTNKFRSIKRHILECLQKGYLFS